MKLRQRWLCLVGVLLLDVLLMGVCCRQWYLMKADHIDSGQVQETGQMVLYAGAEKVDAELSGYGKVVALTFDDGPHRIYTPRLLAGLKERGVYATFFLIGKNIEGNEAIVKQIQEEGHLIGNHSQSHTQLTKEDVQKACEEIETTNRQIYEITGQIPSYVRPPFGSWSEELECMIPMTVVLWDIDPLDWKVQDTQKVKNHILSKVDECSTVLLHDVYQTSVDAALEVIDTLQNQGYTFVTVDELLID